MKVVAAEDQAALTQAKLEKVYRDFNKARSASYEAIARVRETEWEMVKAVIDAGLTDCLQVNVSRFSRAIKG